MITLTQEEAARRLNSNDNLAVIINHNRGVGNHTGESRRKVGDVKTDEEKEFIASLAIDNKLNGKTYKSTAQDFNIHPATLGDWTRGALNNSPTKNDEKSVRKPQEFEEKISTKALDRLVSALDLLTEDKINNLDGDKIASVAVKMATVNEKVNNKNINGSNITINIMTPKLLEEKHFDVIEVTAS